MVKLLIATFILYSLLGQSHEFRLMKNVDKINDYYEVQFQNSLDLKPSIGYVDSKEINDFSDRYVYEVTLPKETDQNYGVFIEKADDNLKDLVIIKSKEKIVDLGPYYTLIRQLDKIKYMVLWLNVYCSVHPDCDKTKMNEDLRKDFINSISPTTEKVKVTTLRPDVTEDESMIIVPLNIESVEACKGNKTEMDINGICRLIWN